MKRSVTGVLILSLVAAAMGCSKDGDDAESTEKKAVKPLNVRVWNVQLSDLTERVFLQGRTTTDRDVTFAAEVPGRVETLAVDNGSRVEKGDLLARIDYATLKAQKEQAKADWALADRTYERLESLFKEELATEQQVDEALTRVRVAKAGLELAAVQLKKATVASTIDGVVARKMVEAGEYVNPGQAIVHVVDLAHLVITAQVPEKQVSRLKRGMPVQVKIDSLGEVFDGEVHVVMPAAHPTSRTFEVRIKVPNPEYRILVGMTATLDIVSQTHAEVVVVRQDWVVESGEDRFVFVVDGEVAHRRLVRLGPVEGERVLILDGLSAGDDLVIEGQRSLYDGQKVKVVQ